MYFLFVLLLQGDAGGPLTTPCCPRRLVGILSWGWNCGDPYCYYGYFPAVYTKVSAVRNWILNACSAPIVAMEITKADAIP
jgi:secreted trypsin-like serine protease